MSAIAEQTAKIDHVLLAGFTHDAIEELVVAPARSVCRAGLDAYFFLGRWLNRRRSRAENRGAVLAEFRPAARSIPSSRSSTPITATRPAPCPSALIRSSPIPSAAFRFPVHRVHSAYCYRCPVGKTRATCDIECVDQLAQSARGKAPRNRRRDRRAAACRARAA